MKPDTTNRLDDFDDEDIFDVVGLLQDSFGLKFKKDAFLHVQTFGDLCRVFEAYLVYPQTDDCTSQQAFYKVRFSLQKALDIPSPQILPQSSLDDLFPKKGRKKAAESFKRTLGVNVRLFTYSDTVSGLLVLGLLLSCVALFFAWKVALCIIGTIVLLYRLEQSLAPDFATPTVGELVQQLSAEHYMSVRRNRGRVNHREVESLIKETFARRFGLEQEQLTNDARFSWAEKISQAVWMYKMSLRALLAITVTIVLLMSCLAGTEQNLPSMRDILSQIKRIPARYTKGYVYEGKGKLFTNVDSTYRMIVQMDTSAIIRLLPVLSDTATTTIPNTCDGGYLTYGQLAFLLIHDIEPVPFSLVTKWQWCTMDDCGWLPDGFLAYLKKRPAEFEQQYHTYLASTDRQRIRCEQ